MDVIRWKNEILRWDIPDRIVATFGMIWLTFVTLVAGFARMFTAIFAQRFDAEAYASSAVAGFGLSSIITVYVLTVLASAVLFAMPPREGKTVGWLILLASATLFMAFIGIGNFTWWSRFDHSIVM